MKVVFQGMVVAGLFSAALLAVSCASTPVNPFDGDHPAISIACPYDSEDIDPATRSFAGILKAANVRGWAVMDVQPSQGYLIAQIDYRGINFIMRFDMLESGNVEATKLPASGIHPKHAQILVKLMRLLDSAYLRYRCMSRSAAEEVLSMNGVTP